MGDQKFGAQLIQNVGAQAAGGVVGQILGLATAGINDRRQIRQQQKLQDMQIRGQQQMLDYSKAKDLEMWRETSYPAQVEMLKKAGLNPGLMYGMGGGGGTTTGGSGPGVSGAQAPSGGGEIMGMMSAGMQAQMMAAQTDLMKANADKARADAENARGVIREQGEATIDQLKANTKNTEAQTMILDIQKDIQNIEYNIKRSTRMDVIGQIKDNARKTFGEMKSAVAKGWLDDTTYNTNVKIIEQSLTNMIVQKRLMEMQQKGIASNIEVNDATIKKITQDIINGMAEVDIKRGLLFNDTWRTGSNLSNALQQLGINQQNANTNESRMYLDALMDVFSGGHLRTPGDVKTEVNHYSEDKHYNFKK